MWLSWEVSLSAMRPGPICVVSSDRRPSISSELRRLRRSRGRALPLGGDRVRASRMHALSDLWFRAKLVRPNLSTVAAGPAAIASVFCAAVNSLTPAMADGIVVWGCSLAAPSIGTTAVAAQSRVVATPLRLCRHLSRLEALCDSDGYIFGWRRQRWAEVGRIGVIRAVCRSS